MFLFNEKLRYGALPVIVFLAVSVMLIAYAERINADDAKSLNVWIKSISFKLKLISTSTGKNKRSVVTGVKVITPEDARKNAEAPAVTAGTKGSATGKDEELYYKDIKVSENETALMESAVRLAEIGDKKGASEKLNELLRSYPKSALAKDAKEGLKALGSEIK